MKISVICIDGDYGSGNLIIAKKVAERFGYACHIANDELASEQDNLFCVTGDIQSKLAKAKENGICLAYQGNCVLAEMYIVDELQTLGIEPISVYITGTVKSRTMRIVTEQNITQMQAHRLVRNRDFGYHLPPKVRMTMKIVDLRSYDLLIDTSKIALDEAVERIADEIQNRSLQ